jgi:hypothetical protein
MTPVSTSSDGGNARILPATPPADHPIGLHTAGARSSQRDHRHRSFS